MNDVDTLLHRLVDWSVDSVYSVVVGRKHAWGNRGCADSKIFIEKQYFFQFLFLLTTSPAFQNTCSHGTDEAGVHRYCLCG